MQVFRQALEVWNQFQIRVSGKLGIFAHANSADRTYTLPDKTGTVALLSDVLANTTCYVNTIGNGVLTTIPVVHNLGSDNLSVSVWETSGSFREVPCEKRKIDNNTLNLIFTFAPTLNSLKVIVIANNVNANFVNDYQEFAYNSSTTTADDTTSFALGSAGITTAAFAPTGTTGILKRIQFARDILSTDVLLLEFSNGGPWIPLANFYADASANYGARVMPSGTTANQANVYFYSKPWIGSTWAALSSYKWRVRKVSQGNFAQVPDDIFSIGIETLTNKVWDGKRVSRKVINTGALPNNTTKTIAHGITGITAVVVHGGYASNATPSFLPLPYVSPAALANCVGINADTTNVYIVTGIDRTSFTNSYVILEFIR